MEPDDLAATAEAVLLNDEEVEVVRRVGLASGVGAEEDDAHRFARRLAEPPSRLMDQVVGDPLHTYECTALFADPGSGVPRPRGPGPASLVEPLHQVALRPVPLADLADKLLEGLFLVRRTKIAPHVARLRFEKFTTVDAFAGPTFGEAVPAEIEQR